MVDEIKKYLFDINEAILSIENYLGEKRDFNVYLQNKMLRQPISTSAYHHISTSFQDFRLTMTVRAAPIHTSYFIIFSYLCSPV